MYAVIELGGKQYRVTKGEEILVDKIARKPGDKIKLGKVIFLSHGDKKIINQKQLTQAQVKGTIIEQAKGEKLVVFKYKPKKNYHRKIGHRDLLTKVKIDDIILAGKSLGKVPKSQKLETEPETAKKPKKQAGVVTKGKKPKARAAKRKTKAKPIKSKKIKKPKKD